MKGCFAREILNREKLSDFDQMCSIRHTKNLCCRDCENVEDCSRACSRSGGRCCYYIDRKDLVSTQLAFKLDPLSNHWLLGYAKHIPSP